MSSRSTLKTLIRQLDLGDHTMLQRNFKELIFNLIDTGGVGFGGSKFYVDATNGKDSNSGLGPDEAVKTLSVAYALLTDNANDMLFLIGGASSLNIPTNFVWAKSYTHFLGLASSLRAGGRARLGHSTDFTPLFPVSGNGCQFANLHIQHGRGNAANLINAQVSGSRNSFFNCHFEGPLNTTEGGAAFRELQITNAAEANTFIDCNIGAWSAQATGATGREIELLGNVSDTYFENCMIRCMNDTAGHEMVEAGTGVGDGSITIEMESCKFIQHDASATLTKLIEHPTNGYILLNNCVAVRATAFSSDNTKVLEANCTIV